MRKLLFFFSQAFNIYFISNDVQEILNRKQYDNITFYIIGKPQKSTACLLGEKLKQMEFL